MWFWSWVKTKNVDYLGIPEHWIGKDITEDTKENAGVYQVPVSLDQAQGYCSILPHPG